MQVNPYLNFNGECETAFQFYTKTLGGTNLVLMKFGDTPAGGEMPPGWSDKIIHARVTVGGSSLMGSDAPPPRYQKPQGMMVSLLVDTPADADRIFQALAEGGNVTMPIQETFWALRFGMVTDRFGISWMVNCEKAA